MTPETRRKALQQTARMAFGASQSKEAQVEPLPTVSASAIAPPVPASPPAPSSACAIAVAADGGVVGSSLRCCIEATRAAAKSEVAESHSWATERPDLAACCQAIDATETLVGALYQNERGWSPAACSACLQALNRPLSSCTPWGPPMPPPMA